MGRATEIDNANGAGSGGDGRLFGIPLGELGWFASLLMGTAAGFAAFFAGTFLGIVGILVYNTATHGAVDFAYSYRRVGLPVGVGVMVLSLGYLGTLWVKRLLRRS
jgi:hypothetical protein